MMLRGFAGALVLSFAVAACSSGATTGGDGSSDMTTDTPVSFGPVKDTGQQFYPVDAVEGRSFDGFVPGCKPGEGCFSDQCLENGDCLAGWCVEHMGNLVCSQTCEEECPAGWSCKQVTSTGPDIIFICVSDFPTLCRPCTTDAECNSTGDQVNCIGYGLSGSFCGGDCDPESDVFGGSPCPAGYDCELVSLAGGEEPHQCVFGGSECPCAALSVEQGLWTTCKQFNTFGECEGVRTCTEEGLTACDAAVPDLEVCNGLDDDCDGETDGLEEDCASMCGEGVKVCLEGEWGECSTASPISCTNYATCLAEDVCIAECPEPPPEVCNGLDDDCDLAMDEDFPCVPGNVEEESCGNCGHMTRTCDLACEWEEWTECLDEGACIPGEIGTEVCGNCGTKTRTCDAKCDWSQWSECIGEGFCVAGETQVQPCGMCGTQTMTCSDTCAWSGWGDCVDDAVCVPGESQSQPCGNCGTKYSYCMGTCQWGPWGDCQNQGECSPNQSQNQTCGNCGSQSRTCNGSCWWNPWSFCDGQGICFPGSLSTSGCANSCQVKTCSNNCSWPDACDSCASCNTYSKCGIGCPTTHHATSYNYSMSCGSNCCNDNQTSCAPNCGSNYSKCGMGCPSGYHATSYNYSMSCGSNCCNDNQTSCQLTAGNSFSKCGMGCPAGYHATSYNYSMSCGSNCCNDNQTSCVKD